MEIKIKDILRVCKGKLIFGDEEIVCDNFSKDTRTLVKGDVYVGIKGENFDGNTLYIQAFEKGAKVCLLQGISIDSKVEEKYKDRAIIIVDDTIKALQKIAELKREMYNIPVIAITGSVGKTSTKDIISSVVSMKYNVLKTQGNLNNHIGVPLTILGLKDHNALVVEMGMNNLGEISVLSKIAKPNIAVITNVGTSHIGNLGSRENILKAKLEILEGLQDDGILIINNDNDMLNKWKNEYKGNVKIITYGIENKSDIMANSIELDENSSNFTIEFDQNFGDNFNKNYDLKQLQTKEEDCKKINVPVGGKHFVYNALSAVSVGLQLGIPIEDIKLGIQKFELSKSRMELINLKNDIIIINDCYNANYDSMKAGIEYLGKTNANRKIAILGDMLELGNYAKELHEKVGEEVVRNKIDILITVGSMGKIIAKTAQEKNIKTYACDNNEEATKIAEKIIKSGDIILIKASNGMKFKEIVENLTSNCLMN